MINMHQKFDLRTAVTPLHLEFMIKERLLNVLNGMDGLNGSCTVYVDSVSVRKLDIANSGFLVIVIGWCGFSSGPGRF